MFCEDGVHPERQRQLEERSLSAQRDASPSAKRSHQRDDDQKTGADTRDRDRGGDRRRDGNDRHRDRSRDARRERDTSRDRPRRDSRSPPAKQSRRDGGFVPTIDPQEAARQRGKTNVEPNPLFLRSGTF